AKALDASSACPSDAGGCTTRDGMYASEYFQSHELAHGYVYRAWGNWSVQLLDEGEAVALSCHPMDNIYPGDTMPASNLVAQSWRDQVNLGVASVDAQAAYLAAGYFVTHLVRAFGWEKLKSLHQHVAYGADADTFDRTFGVI